MEELKILDNTILIVMDEDKEKVIQYFSEKKRRHVKIFTLSEFMNQYYFSYDERAIYYLKCHYQFQYDVSLMYLSLLYDVIDTNILDEKVRMVQEIKRELEEHHLLFFHPYFREYLEDKEILFFDVFFDSRAQKLYSDLEKNFKVSKFYLEREIYNREVMYEFSDIETEVVYVASSILEKIKGGTLPSQIKLCGVTGEYLPVIKRVFSWFSLPLNLSDNYLYGTVMGQDFLALLESDIFLTMDSFSKKYTLKQKEEVEIFEMICDIVNRYSWVDDYLEVRNFLIHDFKRAKIKGNVDSNAIEVLSHLRNVRDDSIVFLLGFNQGLIPKLKRDEGYFNDTLKKKLGLLTTGDENKLEKERWLQEISHVKNLVITSKKKSPLGEFYLSSLNDDLKMRVEEGKITYLYSDLYNQLVLGEKLDTLVKYNEREDDLDYLYQGYRDIPYLTYDSSFTGIDKEKLREYLKGEYQRKSRKTDSEIDTETAIDAKIERLIKRGEYSTELSYLLAKGLQQILEKQSDALWERIKYRSEDYLSGNSKSDFQKNQYRLQEKIHEITRKIVIGDQIDAEVFSAINTIGMMMNVFSESFADLTVVLLTGMTWQDYVSAAITCQKQMNFPIETKKDSEWLLRMGLVVACMDRPEGDSKVEEWKIKEFEGGKTSGDAKKVQIALYNFVKTYFYENEGMSTMSSNSNKPREITSGLSVLYNADILKEMLRYLMECKRMLKDSFESNGEMLDRIRKMYQLFGKKCNVQDELIKMQGYIDAYVSNVSK